MKLSIDTWDETNNIESTSKTLNDLNHQCQKSSEKKHFSLQIGQPSPKPTNPSLTEVKHASNLAEKICQGTQLDQDACYCLFLVLMASKYTYSLKQQTHLKS